MPADHEASALGPSIDERLPAKAAVLDSNLQDRAMFVSSDRRHIGCRFAFRALLSPVPK
jgi:hypothetical protein